jgi:hypothetical protein
MAVEPTPCLFCPLTVTVTTTPPEMVGTTAHFATERTMTCKRCGEYRVSERLAWLPLVPAELKRYLSAAARQASDAGAPILLDQDNFEEAAAPRRSVAVSQKVEKVLGFVARRCGHPGTVGNIDFDLDYVVADCADAAELRQYVEYLSSDRRLLKVYYDANRSEVTGYSPTIEGWQAIEPTLPVDGEPHRCFVAMWFTDELDSVYDGAFYKAIRECGFQPYRVKEDPTNKGITDRILSEIRRARFVVADFTGQRQSVYYEAGFAHGLGREVIGCCREDEIGSVAFDTRHLGHVVWKDAADLKVKLADSIRANIIPNR